MASSSHITLQVLLLALAVVMAAAGCPYAARMAAGKGVARQPPSGHVPISNVDVTQPAGVTSSRKLKQAATPTTVTYEAAVRALAADFEDVLGTCQFSFEGMRYNKADILRVNSTSVFFPAASWLRAFFHDAGTFIKQPSKGGPQGGPNGSLGIGCNSNTCGALGVAVPVDPTVTCLNLEKAVGGFSDGRSYCCPAATQCVAHGQSANGGPDPGETVPVCLTGSPSTVELCRRENDNLLPTIQFFRGRQADPQFMWGPPGDKRPVSFADVLVIGAVATVKRCSADGLVIPYTFGRPDALVADDTPLPSPDSIIEDRHNSIFQQMGLNKVDMVTLVTGSHAIGGFRTFSSPGLTGCPYVPFDCTPAGQISGAPFDNNVFKVACDGVQGVSMGECSWNTNCSDTSVDEPGCPFTPNVRQAFAACDTATTQYPTPGLGSDIHLCRQPSTRQRMVQYANDQAFFFAKYGEAFQKLAFLGYRNTDLRVLV